MVVPLPIDRILGLCQRVKPQGQPGRWLACCPAHDDKTASLSLGVGEGGRVLLKCHAGCGTEAIVSALGLTMSDLYPDKTDKQQETGRSAARRIVAEYPYIDAQGRLLYQAIRFDPKGFSQRRPDGRGGWIWNLNGINRVLYRLPEVILAVQKGTTVYIVEGEKDVHNLSRLGLVATTNAGGAGKWADSYTHTLVNAASVVILPDNDEAGEKHAHTVATALYNKVGSIKIVRLPNLAPKGDVSDWLKQGGTTDELQRLIDAAPIWTPDATLNTASNIYKSATDTTYKTYKTPNQSSPDGLQGNNIYENAGEGTYKTYKTLGPGNLDDSLNGSQEDTPPTFEEKPRSLAPELLPVEPLPLDMLPHGIGAWCADVAERGSFPLEYVAISALVALSSVIGRRIGIRPKRFDDWTVVPNLWGLVVGPPGVFKTPALTEALKPLQRLEVAARAAHQEALSEFEAAQEVSKAQAIAAKGKLKKAAESGKGQEELLALARQATPKETDDKPTCTRYIVNDVTVEKLGELLGENPNGVLMYRDEMMGFLKSLDRQGHENDRSFYLEAWNGTGAYTYDRIGRGTVVIESVCLSLLGGIQPGPLSRYLRTAAEGAEADGFVSRFQLMVYPNPPRKFVNVDRWPNTTAKNEAFAIFERLANLTPAYVGGVLDEGKLSTNEIPFLHFSSEAQEVFDGWRCELENRLRAGHESPLLILHLSKYRSLMPSLALLFHLIEAASIDFGENEGAVSLPATQNAIRWCAFLESHARRIYQSALDSSPEAAQGLAERIRQSLPNPFTPRQVVQKGWAGLSTTLEVEQAIGVLEDRGWVKSIERRPPGGGRPSTEVWIHPVLARDDSASSNLPIESIFDWQITPGDNGEEVEV